MYDFFTWPVVKVQGNRTTRTRFVLIRTSGFESSYYAPFGAGVFGEEFGPEAERRSVHLPALPQGARKQAYIFKEIVSTLFNPDLETDRKPQVTGVLLAVFEAASKRGGYETKCPETSQYCWSLEGQMGTWKKRCAVYLGRAFGAAGAARGR